MTTQLKSFLSTRKVACGSEFTHAALGLNKGSYYIPSDDEEEFLALYYDALEKGADLDIVERHRDQSPILIDLDFRQDTEARRYTDEMIVGFLSVLKEQIMEYTEAHDIKFFVLEKGIEARLDKKSGGYKDGIHVVCPDVVTKPEVQYIIRNNIIEKSMQGIFGDTFTNSYADIYDEAVIYRNGWFMFGSKKPDEEYPWVVTKVYNTDLEEVDNVHSDQELLSVLSIRNKFECVAVKEGKLEEVKAYKDKTNKKETKQVTKQVTQATGLPSNLDRIRAMVMMLKPERAYTYKEWIKWGMCLKSISNTDECLGIWIEFSKQSPKHAKEAEGECKKEWRGLNPQSITEGTLRHFAKLDNPKAYAEMMKDDLAQLVYEARTVTHTDVAKVVHKLYSDRFVCCYMDEKPCWYEFKNHRWEKCPNAVSLKLLISNEVSKLFVATASKYFSMASEAADDTEQERFTNLGKKMTNVSMQLKMASFKANVVSECCLLLAVSDKDFYDKLDSMHHLIGFDNGIFDLKEMAFRDGVPDDYVSMSVGYDYVEEDTAIQQDLLKFLMSITPSKDVLEYLLYVLAYKLGGDKFLEQAWFFTGLGRNGKTTITLLLEQALKKGEYYHEGDVSVLTNIRRDANAASSAIMALRNKRVAVFSESEDKDETIKVKVLKQMIGRDLIQGRELYAKRTVEFRPTFSMIFLMNDMPKLSKLEPNLLDKLNVIRFPYRFCDNPKKDSNEKQIDKTLKSKFEGDVRYKQQFMRILLDSYAKHKIGEGNTMQPPEEVKKETKAYFDENDEVGMWFKDKCTVTNDPKDRMTPTEMFYLFKQDNPGANCKRVEDFGKGMSMNGHTASKHDGGRYYKCIKYNGYLIRDDNTDQKNPEAKKDDLE